MSCMSSRPQADLRDLLKLVERSPDPFPNVSDESCLRMVLCLARWRFSSALVEARRAGGVLEGVVEELACQFGDITTKPYLPNKYELYKLVLAIINRIDGV